MPALMAKAQERDAEIQRLNEKNAELEKHLSAANEALTEIPRAFCDAWLDAGPLGRALAFYFLNHVEVLRKLDPELRGEIERAARQLLPLVRVSKALVSKK